MATPYVSGTEAADLVKMVRDYNVIIQDKGSVSDAKIIDYLNNHSFPRIRGRLITATDSMNNHIFYDDIKDLSNPAASTSANALVVAVMTDSIVKDYVFRIAAALAAAWAINMLVGQLEAQQKIAWQLEKEAMQDLGELVRSPELVAAAQQAKKNTADTPTELPRIYIALDSDPATYNPANNTVGLYSGAQEAGIARLWLGPYQISANVAVGDNPNTIMNKLLQALRAIQISPVPGMNYNLVFGPNEGMVNLADTKYIKYKPNPLSPEVMKLATVAVNLGYMEFYAYQHSPDVDGLFCTLELLKADGVTPGIKGIVYSTGRAINYSSMTVEGPHSVFIDLTQGQGQNSGNLKDKLPTDLSDTFYFNVPGATGKLTAAGVVTYQIQNLVSAPSPPATAPRSVNVAVGDSALDIVLKIARDIEKYGAQYKVLSAVRSPTNVAISGTITTMPGLRIVPYRPDPINRKIIFDILSVPAELNFGVVPQAMAGIGGPFENHPKSLVLEANFSVQGNTVSVSPMTGTVGGARVAEPKTSNRLYGALSDITLINRGIF